MTPELRDPKHDPQPGDVLRANIAAGQFLRKVRSNQNGVVRYAFGQRGFAYDVDLEKWQKLNRNAEIVWRGV